jgi:peptidyl-prolyl cis-trans isomerase D
MLRNIHKASSTWLGKALMATVMGFLVISFAVWGIADIFRGGFGQNNVASVGSSEITIEQFRQFYNDRLQQISRQAGRPITPDQARGLGLDRQILGQMIAQATLDEQARNMHLGLSDPEIAKRITDDPTFKGPNGQFDRNRFLQAIRDAGYTEPRFVAEQRNVLLRRQIAQTVGGDVVVPTVAMEAINRFQNEHRDIDYLVLGPAQAGDIPAPTDEQLTKYFDERKASFRAPEYRKVTLLALSPAELAKPDQVSDADAKTYFDQHQDQYGTPEKRELHQMVFPDEAKAAAAREEIAKGKSFADVATERGLKASDVDVGTVTKKQVIAPAAAAAAFSLPVNEVSQPVKGRFGTLLLLVTKIEPGSQQAFDDVKAQIKQTLAEQRARSSINDLRDKVEDERASGATLPETAQKLGLKAVSVDAVDRSGRGPDGKPVPAMAAFPQNLLTSVFSTDVGVDNEALQLPNGGFLYFDVAGVTPSHERKLEEIKPQVEASWRDDQVSQTLQKKADDLLAKIKGGATLEQAASEAGVTVQKAIDLQRGRAAPNVPASVVDDVFKTAKDGTGTATGTSDTQRFVYRVTQVTDPALDANAVTAQQVKSVLANSYSDDLVGEYLARLESDYKVSINQSALNQVVGGQTEQ